MARERLLLKVTEACDETGASRSKAYELVANGEWPSVRLGRAVRIPRAGLLAWIERVQRGGVANADR